MNIFESLDEVLFTKENKELDTDAEQQYQPYMINRWISMYSPALAIAVNSTSNMLWPLYKEDKQLHYKLMQTVLPCAKKKHINYIKKTKQNEEDNAELIRQLAERLELSEREIKYLLNERKYRPTLPQKTSY
jgi:hypothetical protein